MKQQLGHSLRTGVLVGVLGLAQLVSGSWVCGQEESSDSFARSIKIAQFLWSPNPRNAATTLEKVIQQGVQRDQLDILGRDLAVLRESAERLCREAAQTDPRYTVSVAVCLLTAVPSDREGLGEWVSESLDREASRMLLDAWLACEEPSAWGYVQARLRAELSTDRAWMVQAIFEADRQRAAELVLELWAELDASTHQACIEPLTGTASTMRLLLAGIRTGKVQRDLLNPNQLRKWLQNDPEVVGREIEAIWGRVRSEENLERRRVVEETLSLLRSGVSGSVTGGEVVFKRVCAQCHQLHGQGFEVGPNISGNGRGSLDQLVSNVMDPSLVIGEAFQSKTVLTYDGEVISGLLVGETDRYLTLKIQGGQTREFSKEDDIEQVRRGDKSLMPEGVEQQMTEQELIDLFAFLCLLKPLGSEDNELIPGTPAELVQP